MDENKNGSAVNRRGGESYRKDLHLVQCFSREGLYLWAYSNGYFDALRDLQEMFPNLNTAALFEKPEE